MFSWAMLFYQISVHKIQPHILSGRFINFLADVNERVFDRATSLSSSTFGPASCLSLHPVLNRVGQVSKGICCQKSAAFFSVDFPFGNHLFPCNALSFHGIFYFESEYFIKCLCQTVDDSFRGKY